MTNRATTLSALSFLLLTAACAGGDPGDVDDSSGVDMTSPSDVPIISEETGGSDDRVASIHGTVASVADGRYGLADVSVCVLNPIFACTRTDDSGDFEIRYAPKDTPMQLSFFREDLVPATQVASTAIHAQTLMVPRTALPAEMGATVSARGGVVIEMLPFTYDTSEEIPPVELAFDEGAIEYFDSDGKPDASLSAVAPHGVALAVGAESGTVSLEAAALGHAGCIFVEGGLYEPILDVEFNGNFTTTVQLACGAE